MALPKGVSEYLLRLVSAPAFKSSLIISRFPLSTALSKGVFPSIFLRLTSAPELKSALTISRFPLSTALFKGVYPSIFLRLILVLSLIRPLIVLRSLELIASYKDICC